MYNTSYHTSLELNCKNKTAYIQPHLFQTISPHSTVGCAKHIQVMHSEANRLDEDLREAEEESSREANLSQLGNLPVVEMHLNGVRRAAKL